jgi:signal transduction histidine kinase
MGFSELLYEKVEKNNFDDVKKYAQLIYTISNQSFSLLNNLLDWSLSQTKGLQYNPETIPLNDLTTHLRNYYSTLAQNKKISIEINIKDDLSIYADKNMINTVLRNLISNALKYTPQGGSIIISASKVTNDVHVSVCDTGIGIEANTLKKLFKIEESTSTKGLENEKGTGLGLILCKDFVEVHKGRIWAESEPGKGSTFNFTLPSN